MISSDVSFSISSSHLSYLLLYLAEKRALSTIYLHISDCSLLCVSSRNPYPLLTIYLLIPTAKENISCTIHNGVLEIIKGTYRAAFGSAAFAKNQSVFVCELY